MQMDLINDMSNWREQMRRRISGVFHERETTGLMASNLFTSRELKVIWRIPKNAFKFHNNLTLSRLYLINQIDIPFEDASVLFRERSTKWCGLHNRVIIVWFHWVYLNAHKAYAFGSRKSHASWRKKKAGSPAEDFFIIPWRTYMPCNCDGHVPAVMTSFATKFNLQRPPAVLNFRFPFRLILSRIASSLYVQRAYDFRGK